MGHSFARRRNENCARLVVRYIVVCSVTSKCVKSSTEFGVVLDAARLGVERSVIISSSVFVSVGLVLFARDLFLVRFSRYKHTLQNAGRSPFVVSAFRVVDDAIVANNTSFTYMDTA